MKKKVVFLDFYGTVVHEDDKAIPFIAEEICRDSKLKITANEVYQYWAKRFTGLLSESYGIKFELQRDILIFSLKDTIAHFESKGDPFDLSKPLFEHWTKPPIFEDSKQFLEGIDIPVCIVSNIDRADLLMAMEYHNLKFDYIITSEDARSYKPRPEMFHGALKEMSVLPEDVIHMGDSMISDVLGAKKLGITAAWINRKQREPSNKISPDLISRNLIDLLDSDFISKRIVNVTTSNIL